MPRLALSMPTSIPAAPAFTAFDADDVWLVPGYRRNLPHWRLSGATYFVTFRLADSIPAEVAQRWKQEEAQWFADHGTAASSETPDANSTDDAQARINPEARAAFRHRMMHQFFVELDACHGRCVLAIKAAQMCVAESLGYFHGQRLWTGDFVIMPNHVHVIVQPFPGVVLEEWLYSVKRFTASALAKLPEVRNALLTRAADHVWQAESFDRVIRDAAELKRTRDYIANNPRHLPARRYHLQRADWLDQFAA